MQFTSFSYLLSLPLVFAVTYNLSPRARRGFLLAAAYVFYASYIPQYALVLAGLTLLDYTAAIAIDNSRAHRRKARAIWIGSLAANVGLLVAFKLNLEISEFMSWPWAARWILPIGLSFHTFQSMAYTTLVYKGRPAERNWLTYSLFIAWFPQLAAGPIERADDLIPQLREIRNPRAAEIKDGLILIIFGFFKKLVIADNLAGLVYDAYLNSGSSSPWLILAAVYAFAFQIYFDFSGYTDIARGSSLLFGVRLSENFNRPLLARTIPEFWSRWNITLSTWFFEHVYFPLARRFPGPWGVRGAIMTVFLLSGFWHGTGWKFIIWGALNGVFYLIYQSLGARLSFRNIWANAGLVVVNFNILAFCWILFRAESLNQALEIFSRIGELPFAVLPSDLGTAQYMLAKAAAGAGLFFGLGRFADRNPARILGLLILVMLTLGRFSGIEFIYFQF